MGQKRGNTHTTKNVEKSNQNIVEGDIKYVSKDSEIFMKALEPGIVDQKQIEGQTAVGLPQASAKTRAKFSQFENLK